MSFIKNITESLMSGNVFAARRAFNNLVMEAVPAVKPNLRDVKEFLSDNPETIVKNFLNTNEGQNLLGYTGDDANVGIDHFVKYVSDVTGVHANMFKNWNALKDVVSFYNQNVSKLVELPEIKDPKQYWTHFQMDVIPSDDVSDQDHVMPNTGSGAVTQGQRDDFVGVGASDSDSVGNMSPNASDAVYKAAADTHVSNRDFGADKGMTSKVNDKDAEAVKRVQNVGVTASDREEHRTAMQRARDAKYPNGIENAKGTQTPGARSISSRQNDGGGRSKKYSDMSEKEWIQKYNAMKLANKIPAGVKNYTDLKNWFDKNGQ